MVFTLRHGSHVGAHLQKSFNELLLLCAPTWPLSFESHRTKGHVSENHLKQLSKAVHYRDLTRLFNVMLSLMVFLCSMVSLGVQSGSS